MKKHILNAIEVVLICLLLLSSYLGFFFSGLICICLDGTELTSLILVLWFLCSCGLTHMILRWLNNVQGKGW
jgi:hypothetical protein